MRVRQSPMASATAVNSHAPRSSATDSNSTTSNNGAATINATTSVSRTTAILIVRITIAAAVICGAAAAIICSATAYNGSPPNDRAAAINGTAANRAASVAAATIPDLHDK